MKNMPSIFSMHVVLIDLRPDVLSDTVLPILQRYSRNNILQELLWFLWALVWC